MGTSASDPKCGSLRTQARKKSSIAWSHLSVGGCTRRSTPGFLFCGSDLVASGGREEVPQGISEASRKATKARKQNPSASWGNRAGRRDRATRSDKTHQTSPEPIDLA